MRSGFSFIPVMTEDTENFVFNPNKLALAEKYANYMPSFQTLLSRLHKRLESVVVLRSAPSFRTRIKDFESYYKKLLKYPPKEPTSDIPTNITDIVAIRIVCSFLNDLATVEHILQDNFEIVEVEKKGAGRTVIEFGYESIHVLLKVPEDLKKGLELPEGLVFEIQIRTILQDAWAEVEHELVYKADFSPFDLPLKRKMAAINASLSLADIIFQEIRDYQNKLNVEIEKRRSSFYAKADDFTAGFLCNMAPHAVPDEPAHIYDPESIDDLVLQAISAHNAGDFQKAEIIYTKIIDKTDDNVILSVICKHRGMAYFAQGKYEQAHDDFMRSVGYDENNFRSQYYVAISLTLLGKHAEAIEYFTASLRLNPYQAHVHFRRALSEYQLSRYVDALHDLDAAQDLGYKGDDLSVLRVEISKKMQML